MTEPALHLVVLGHPATAGSKTGYPFLRGYRPDGKPILGLRMAAGRNAADARKKQAWRDAVSAAVLGHERIVQAPLDGPLLAWADFYLLRPKTVKAPWPTGRPDWSKLMRALEDPVVSPAKGYPGLIRDDARICFAMGGKFYAEDTHGAYGPRAELRVWTIPDPQWARRFVTAVEGVFAEALPPAALFTEVRG